MHVDRLKLVTRLLGKSIQVVREQFGILPKALQSAFGLRTWAVGEFVCSTYDLRRVKIFGRCEQTV